MRKIASAILLLLIPGLLLAQAGKPNFGSFTSSNFDIINNQNLNAFIAIPIASSGGRGMPLSLSLVNNSLLWANGGGFWTPVVDANGNPTWGWVKDFPVGGQLHYTTSTFSVPCPTNKINVTQYRGFYYVDALGTNHTFNAINYYRSACSSWNKGPTTSYADDRTGYYADGSTFWVTGPNGMNVLGGVSTAGDSNGNYVTKTAVSSTETDWTDSIGNRALKIIYSPSTTSPTSIQYQFLDGTGASNYQTITLKLQAYSIKTNFACSGVTEYTGTAYLPYELDIPSPVSGTIKYLFTYEGTPGNSGFYTGRLKRVTLPAGGYIEYAYPGANDSVNCSDATTLSLNRVVSDGTNSATWNFVHNTSNLTTTVTTPQLADTPTANDTVYTFNSSGQEVSRKTYANSPGTTLLRTINTTWATNGTPATQVNVLEDGSTQAETDTTMDSNGLLNSVSEYDFGSGARGNLLRTTTLTYETSTNYTSRNMINLLTSKVIKDGSGTVQYRQDITHDGVALASCPTGVPQHDDTGHGCSMNYRGNPTQVTTYLTPGTPANGISKNFTFDVFGNLLTAQLNCCQNKTWTYSATTQYSQPDSITSGTSPTQLTTSYQYNLYLGLVTKVTDPNNLATNYSYDFLRRPTQISQTNGSTNGASVSYAYNDIAFTTTSTTSIDSSKSVKQIAASDALGRVITSTTEDANNNIYSIVSTQYDLTSRAYKVSNPYTSAPSYWTTTQLDVLGRPMSVTMPDTSATSYSYAEQYTTVTDPAGKQRKSQADAAGRLTAVFEPDVNNGNSLTQQTTYVYNVLDELTTLTQGSQTRSYLYDALGRLLSATTPESGTTCFGSVTGSTCNTDGYDSFNNLQKRTDARGVLTSYGYDGLNRLQSVSYNVGSSGVPATASVTFTFGTNAAQFNNGRLITMTDGVGSENYSYNALEQTTQLQKIINSMTYTTNYQYNIAGEPTQVQYPSGRIVQQSVDAIGRLCEIAPSTTGCGTATSPYATGYGYNVANEVTGFKYGNGIFASLGFSADRLQLNCLDYSTTNRNGNCAHDATTKFGLTYSYGAAGSNSGQIASITDSMDNGRSVTFTFDSLYRLTRAVTTGSASYPAWGLSETYDRYGNRSAQAIYSGCTGVTCPTNSVTPDTATNRISGYCYDNNGNLLAESAPPCPSPTYTYDAENRTVNYLNAVYTYDGGGLRVKKAVGSSTTVYIFSGNKVIAEYDNGAGVGSPSREYIYSGGALLAKIDSSGTKYYHQDHLSNRLVTDSSGNTSAQMGHFPFGESWYNATNDKLLFTTYERDSESGNDYAKARYNMSRLARFSSPDPLAGSIADPQSLDRYTYVRDNPSNFTDPSGSKLCAPAFCGEQDYGGTWASDWGWADDGLDGFAFYATQIGTTYNFSYWGNANGLESFYEDSLGDLFNAASGGDNITYDGSTPIYGWTLVPEPQGRQGGGGGGNIKPWEVRAPVVKLLRAQNDCSKWLDQGKKGSAADLMSTVPIYLGNPTPGPLPGPDADTRQGPEGPITVYPDGRFYPDSKSRVPVGGFYDPGSPGAMMTILLHELAHKMNAIKPDGPLAEGPMNQSEINTGIVLAHCQKAFDPSGIHR